MSSIERMAGDGSAPVSAAVIVTRDADQRRYQASVGGAGVAGFVDYQETSELVVLTHTEVDPAFEGRGIGSALARAAPRQRTASSTAP